MSGHTVKQVARVSGVSVRTLHHYDEIGLLKPASVGENGYRYYGREELLRLQQILFHRELGFSLEEIGRVLEAKGFDRVAALKAHRAKLEAETRRYRQLVRTIDQTLAALEGAKAMEDKAMYRGFDPKKQAEQEAWIVERYGPEIQRSIDARKAAQKDWKQADFDRHQAEFAAIETGYAEALTSGLPADGETVRALARRHCAWVQESWSFPVTRPAFNGLADLYGELPDFQSRFDIRAPGLTEYMQAAMRSFAEAELA